jgi:uncharacterized protein GlcG (DUF336 family)
MVQPYRPFMNPRITSVLVALSFSLSGAAFAAGAKTYQVTGTVVAATGTMVTVQKGTEKWEIDIDPATTKGFGDLKVGSTITVTYVMSATKLETSAAAAETTPRLPSPTPTP